MSRAGNVGTALRQRYRLVVGVASGVAVATMALVLFFVFDSSPPAPVADISDNYKVCLLDSSQAVDPTTVWHAVQAAIEKAPINAQQLTVPDVPGGHADPTTYLNGLVALHCRLVVTDGADLTEPLAAVAAQNPKIRFLDIGDPIQLSNVGSITPPVTNPQQITAIVLSDQAGSVRK
jgi:basic membrane lipoprotein Med (substrate-binding protein (PBP1-ABC) superfamily)